MRLRRTHFEPGTPGRLRRWARRLAIALVLTVAALTIASFAYNAATQGRQRSAPELYPGPFALVDGRLIAYRRWGSRGTPIVLVGGFVEPSWVWQRVGTLLGRTHRVFALDLPPFGFSQRRGPYTLDSWVQLVRSFDKRLGLDRPLVVGHSLGAAVAVREAVRHPRELRGIVLLDGDALPGGGAAHWLSALLIDPFYTSVFRIATGSDWIVRRALQGAYGRGGPRLDHAALAAWEKPFRVSGTPAAFRTLLGYGIQGVSQSELARVEVPRLVVWGANDAVDSVAAGRQTARALHARFLVLQHAGHLSMLAAPGALAQAVSRLSGR